MEYQQIAAACSSPSLVRMDGPLWIVCPGTVGSGAGGLVFGTLLGPEATGPWFLPLFCGVGVRVCVFLVSWLHRSHGCSCFGGCVCGVCGTGLLFENYIVDASIFYKKQFPRI